MPTRTSKTTQSKTAEPESAATNAANNTANNKTSDKTSSDKSSGKTSKAASNGAANSSHFSSDDLEHFQDLLLQERARLEEEREQIRSRSGSVDGALPEEGEGGDEDTADLASAMMDKEMDLSVEDEIEDLLNQVSHALRKIEDGTYGICDMSGEKIPRGRLELIPWAALTVECQAIAEGQ